MCYTVTYENVKMLTITKGVTCNL